MFNYNQFVRVTTAGFAALILSTLSIGAAIAPGQSPVTAAASYAMISGNGAQADV